MPKSFGNNRFIAPPTRVTADGDAVDLADFQEAMKHMTVMNRFSSGLDQSTRRIRLKSGATAVVRRAFGHQTIQIERVDGTVSRIVPCVPYMESGRQWWEDFTPDPGYIDISSDITGENGAPGSPIAAGISRSLTCSKPGEGLCSGEQHQKKEVRKDAPPSSWTGKLQLFFQAVYGSKRLDVEFVGNASASIAGVTFTHEIERSSILYTDARKKYWVLQIVGLESATIQAWAPKCVSDADTNEIGREAYKLWSMFPSGSEVSLPCDGAESILDEYVAVANGWHAEQKGNIGHIVALGPDETVLYRFDLSDSGAAKQPEQTEEEYVQSRFLLTFSRVIEAPAVITSFVSSVWRPSYFYNDMRLAIGKYPTEFFIEQEPTPIYCRYTADDVLDIVYYSSAADETPEDDEHSWEPSCGMAPDCSGVWSEGATVRGTSGFTVGSLIEPAVTTGGATQQSLQIEMIADAGQEWIDGYPDIICGAEIPDAEGTPCDATFWGYRYLAQIGHEVHIDNLRAYNNKKMQAVIVPFYNHESFVVVEFDTNTNLVQTIERHYQCHTSIEELKVVCTIDDAEQEYSVGGPYSVVKPNFGIGGETFDSSNTDWYYGAHCKVTHFPRTGSPTVVAEDMQEFGALSKTAGISCGLTLSNGWNPPPSWYSLGAEDDDYPITLYGLEDFFFSRISNGSSAAKKITDRESYQYGHKNSKLSGGDDTSLELHDGYDEFVEDGVFVGKS